MLYIIFTEPPQDWINTSYYELSRLQLRLLLKDLALGFLLDNFEYNQYETRDHNQWLQRITYSCLLILVNLATINRFEGCVQVACLDQK